jgi:YD repeat-containing protein
MNGNQVPAGLEKLPRRVWTYERDARGLVVAARSLGGWVVRVHRDAHSRWQELRDAISLVARMEYDDFGDEIAVYNAEAVTTISRFDAVRPAASRSLTTARRQPATSTTALAI